MLEISYFKYVNHSLKKEESCMGKRSKIIFLLFLAQAFMVAPLFARAITDNDYTFTIEKIYQKIDTITFNFQGGTLNYPVILASRFDSLNASHVRLRLDVFIKTIDDNFITNMEVNVTCIANLTINTLACQRTGQGSDQTGFMQYGDLLYTYELCSVDVPTDIFPATVSIAFNYTARSDGGEFVKTNTATVSGFFLGSTIWTIIIVAIIAGFACLIIFGVRAAKRRGGGGGSYKASYKIRSVSNKDIREYEKQKQAELKAEEDTRARADAEARARASVVQTTSQGSIPPVPQSTTVCPACGGGVVNFKCQSCWGKVCRGCGHLNMATSYACEKCGKTL